MLVATALKLHWTVTLPLLASGVFQTPKYWVLFPGALRARTFGLDVGMMLPPGLLVVASGDAKVQPAGSDGAMTPSKVSWKIGIERGWRGGHQNIVGWTIPTVFSVVLVQSGLARRCATPRL